MSSDSSQLDGEPFGLPSGWGNAKHGRMDSRIAKHIDNEWIQGGFLVGSGTDGERITPGGTQTLECKTSEGYVFRVQCHVAPVDRPVPFSGLLPKKGEHGPRQWGGLSSHARQN